VLDSGQSTLFRGGGGEDVIDVLLKIWLSVPNVLATIVVPIFLLGKGYFFYLIYLDEGVKGRRNFVRRKDILP